ncbi:MAG TPA: cytochrome c3 family protein, partial [Bdellovibrionota bacterium]|nr:cytochrome c3 family protein [Bdellovibrionota bacterium]
MSSATAQFDFTKWINPGPLSKPHETLEGVTNCTKCHASAQGIPDNKCLACHTEIGERLAAKKGYHAQQTKLCMTCHGEHKGRNYDETGLTRLPFNHAESGWPLTGGHAKVTCEKCHTGMRKNVDTKKPTTKRTYLGAPTTCVGCHADPHKSQKESFTKCERCHTVDHWKTLKGRLSFNHNNESRYPLTGKHEVVACYGCHKKKTWAPLPFAQCTDCHVDPHKGKLGPNCEKCHNTKTWRAITPGSKDGKPFDHDKTAFPLKGEHRSVTCLRCHGPVIGKMQNFDQCGGCHNNPHGNQFQELWDVKRPCKSCHLEDGWMILSFQHNRDSRYELEEKHLEVPCEQCHIDRKYRWLPSAPDCSTCHQDVHRAQFTKPCASCHTTKSFNMLTFDHNKDSPFPLVGKHQ